MLLSKRLSIHLWFEVEKNIIYLLKKLPTRIKNFNMLLKEVFLGNKPKLCFLKYLDAYLMCTQEINQKINYNQDHL